MFFPIKQSLSYPNNFSEVELESMTTPLKSIRVIAFGEYRINFYIVLQLASVL